MSYGITLKADGFLFCFFWFGDQAHTGLQGLLRVHVKRLDETSGEARPAGLVACAQAFTGIAVEIFEEVDAVVPVGIVLKFLDFAEDWAFAGSVAQENTGEAAADFGGDFEEVHHVAGTGGAFDLERIAEVA